MVELRVETSEGIALRHELAGAGSRSAAALVDALLLLVLYLSIFLASLLLGEVAQILIVGFTLILIAYQVGFGILNAGRTPGGALLGLRVLDQEGVPARPVQHLLRGFFVPLEAFLFVPVPLGLIVMATTPRRQRLGDLVAGTVVVREPRREAEGLRIREPERALLDLVPAHASRFGARDLEFLRELFVRIEVDASTRRRLFVRSARHYLRVLGQERDDAPTPEEASEILRELYAFLRARGAKGALG